ncbi:hypothetical protein EV44_g3918 [Erysiphe necator]|uniref:Uncharacterized protein n=1 Tax=Uncinula necator TaxID=52586 RepID=A0A0B1P9Q4_UNCNE|nr:hypothetical protein EV44_g3918 [Erysiphe necator]
MGDILLSSTSAAATRNEEATLLFQNIACVLDDALNMDHLRLHLHKPLNDFIVDLNAVARRHFDCHINGTERPPKPYTATPIIINPPTSRPIDASKKVLIATPLLSELKKTRPNPTLHHQKLPFTQTQQQRKLTPKKAVVDNRLLVRVSPGHPALKMSPYAIMLYLNAFLREKQVREVQVTKTGFAICPTSISAQNSLHERMDAIEGHLSTEGACKMEKPSNHTAYMISGVPRSYTGYNGTSLTIEITAAQVKEALRDLISIEPISVLQSQNTTEEEYSDVKK